MKSRINQRIPIASFIWHLIFVLVLLVTTIGTSRVSAATTYYRPWDFFPVTACTTAPTQHDRIITLDGGRRLLVTAWMPESLYQTNTTRITELALWADRSTKSTTPLQPLPSGTLGLMGVGFNTSAQHKSWGWADLVVITPRLLLWFDMTSAHQLNAPYNAVPNGGGGQLRGAWQIGVDTAGLLNFKDIRNGSNWAPNALFPGAWSDIEGGGISSFMTEFVADNAVVYNLENDTNAVLIIHAPSTQIENGTGTLHTQGFFVQAIGYFVDTRADGDRYLVGATNTNADSQPGRVKAWTTYRFAACDDKVYLQTIWRNETSKRIGPLVNILVATNVYGEPTGVVPVRSGNLLDFAYTSPDTCVVRLRYANDYSCHTSRVDYNTFAGHEQEYRARASLTTPPPSMILRGRNASGGATPWLFGLHPLSGIISQGVIFDLHSACFSTGCRVLPAHDATLFNSQFWDGPDPNFKVPPGTGMPPGIYLFVSSSGERSYYIQALGELNARMVLQFGY